MKYFILLALLPYCNKKHLSVETMEIYHLSSTKEVYSPYDEENRLAFTDNIFLKKRTYYIDINENKIVKIVRLTPNGYDMFDRNYIKKYGDDFINDQKSKIFFQDHKNIILVNDKYHLQVIERTNNKIYCSLGNLANVDKTKIKDFLVVLSLKKQ